MNLYYLMIKTIDQTGLKYLCKRKVCCKDPLTLKKKYIKDEKDLPAGWVLGLPPTVGYKLISPTGMKYNSFVEAEKKENTTRYKIQQSIKKQTGWKYE